MADTMEMLETPPADIDDEIKDKNDENLED